MKLLYSTLFYIELSHLCKRNWDIQSFRVSSRLISIETVNNILKAIWIMENNCKENPVRYFFRFVIIEKQLSLKIIEAFIDGNGEKGQKVKQFTIHRKFFFLGASALSIQQRILIMRLTCNTVFNWMRWCNSKKKKYFLSVDFHCHCRYACFALSALLKSDLRA